MPEVDIFDWARTQTCSPLNSMKDVEIAKLALAGDELPLHPDRWKNWDNFLGIHHAVRLADPDAPVLDAGACRDPNSPSVFLPSLEKLGFTDLHGCNLDEDQTEKVGHVTYSHQNIEKTTYPTGYFKYIACLSTIEHGVDWNKYFAEMARILRPKGYLFTSFDYWHSPVDTKGQQAFGVPIKVFSENDVMQMALYAKMCGLSIMKRPQLHGQERLVEWMGMKYTFLNLLMSKDEE